MFPVLPLHRLDEQPTVRATLADLTCDSDGHLMRFVQGEETLDRDQERSASASQQPAESLLLHPLRWPPPSREMEPYVLGLFLGGAYQVRYVMRSSFALSHLMSARQVSVYKVCSMQLLATEVASDVVEGKGRTHETKSTLPVEINVY